MRREAGTVLWVTRLPDGFSIRLPSTWTDHPVGQASTPRVPSNLRATPRALRDLTALLETLVCQYRGPDARSDDLRQGGSDERAGSALRTATADLDRDDLATMRCRSAPRVHHDPGGDGPGISEVEVHTGYDCGDNIRGEERGNRRGGEQ